MNLPNKLTMLRICLIPVFVVLASLQSSVCGFLALLVFILASVTDFLDGKIARRDGLVTNFGKFADPIADKMLVMSAFVVLVRQGIVPAWVCIVILAREFMISGLRMVAVESGRVIAAGKLGKIKTFTQMIAILLLLISVTFPFVSILAFIMLYVSLFFTIVSGVEYIVKNFDCIRDM